MALPMELFKEILLKGRGFVDGKIKGINYPYNDSVVITLTNGWEVEFPFRYRPVKCDYGDIVRIDCRERFGGDEFWPMVFIVESDHDCCGLVKYQAGLPAKYITC
jgi:hypothetical protein